jgi:hypothetical protein
MGAGALAAALVMLGGACTQEVADHAAPTAETTKPKPSAGATFEEFDAHMDKESRLSEQDKPFLGPPVYAYDRITSGPIAAHRSTTIEGNLEAGTWGIACLRKFDGVDDRFRVSDGVGPIEVE